MQVSVLFVDDDELILAALKRSLLGSHFDVHLAASAAEALALIERTPIDIIVSDYLMPEMSGVDLLARVRQRHEDTLRILMTGTSDREATIRAINEGRVSGYLEKPWQELELLRVLTQAACDVIQRRPGRAAPNPRAALHSFHNSLDVTPR